MDFGVWDLSMKGYGIRAIQLFSQSVGLLDLLWSATPCYVQL